MLNNIILIFIQLSLIAAIVTLIHNHLYNNDMSEVAYILLDHPVYRIYCGDSA